MGSTGTRLRREPATGRPATAPRHSPRGANRDEVHPFSPAGLLGLQRSAGNHAVEALLRAQHTPVVQRCGAVPADACPCHEPETTGPASVTPRQRGSVEADVPESSTVGLGTPATRDGLPGGGHVETLGDVPVGGAEVVQRACGSAAIGSPAGCTPSSAEPAGEAALFRTNCDDFSSAGQQTVIEDFADSMLPTDAVNVHGFASIDGPGTYNQRLSCARALKAVDVLLGKGVPAGQIRIFSHGATPGNAALRRSVVLERDPPVSRLPVPQLSATVVTAPTPGSCGGMNFVIQWNLSRNSAPRGGFVIQAVQFVWEVLDCAGTPVPNPDPRTSPLQYFEAWRVAPNSQTLSPVTTDTFFWPDASPWGGGCTDGRVAITGVAQYHDNADTLPGDMVANNPATFAGILQSSLSDPALGEPVSNPFDHRLAFHWTCCPCSSSPTVVDDHAP